MHKYVQQFTVVFIFFALTACKKSDNTAVTVVNPVPFPNYAATVWGIMECDKTINYEGYSILYDSSESIYAVFEDNNGAYTTAGNVACNNVYLSNISNLTTLFNPVSYYTSASSELYNYKTNYLSAFGNDISWQVTGSGSVPAISYTIQGIFPQYLDTLPTYVTRSAGYTIPLGANVIGADSVSLTLIYSALVLGSFRNIGIANVVCSAADSAVTLTSGQLSGLSTDLAYGIELAVYKTNIQKFGNKDYIFITKNIIIDSLVVY